MVGVASHKVAFGGGFAVGSVTVGGGVGGVFAIDGGIVTISMVGRLLDNSQEQSKAHGTRRFHIIGKVPASATSTPGV